MPLKIYSPNFEHESPVPSKYCCDGEDINPELVIENLPEGTESIALIVDDPDAPAGTADPGWVHWLVYGLDPATNRIAENSIPGGALQGKNDWGRDDYGGPCPKSGTHRYSFKIYALGQDVVIPEGVFKSELLAGINPHIIEQAELIGTYSQQS